MRSELVNYINIAFGQQVDRPCILRFYASVFIMSTLINDPMDIRSSRNENGGHRPSDQNTVGVNGLPILCILILEIFSLQDRPSLFQCNPFHSLKNDVGHLGTAIVKPLAFPLRGQKYQFFFGYLLCGGGANKT